MNKCWWLAQVRTCESRGSDRNQGAGLRQVLMSLGKLEGGLSRYLLVGPAGLACMGLRDFPGHGTLVAKTRKVLGKLEQVGQLVWGVKYTVLGLPLWSSG